MTRTKSDDEIFCASCGEVVKKAAEICPNCGVRNEIAGSTSSGFSSGPSETTVSDTWWYGVAGAILLWLFFMVWTGADLPGDGGMGLLALIAWIMLPLAAYFDIQYVRANSEWDPITFLWVIAMAIWLLNIVIGGIYLYRRHEVLGEP